LKTVKLPLPEEVNYECGCLFRQNDIISSVRICSKHFPKLKNSTFAVLLHDGLERKTQLNELINLILKSKKK